MIARLIGVGLAVWGLYIGSLEPLFTIIILFVLVVPFERLFPRHENQPVLREELSTDIGYAFASPLLNIVGLVIGILIGILSFAWIPGLLIRPLVALLPPFVKPLVAFFLFDMIVYWAHRWAHEVPFLWRFHAIHHSTEKLDWVSGFRAHPLDGAIIAPAVVFLIAAGFSTETAVVITVLQIIVGLFLHANVRWRLRPMHKIIITPEFHHWHHTNEPDAIWSNYSTFLPLWDLIFGTYYMPETKRPQVYGVDEHIPDGMYDQLVHPFRGFSNPFWIVRHPIRAIRTGLRNIRRLIVQIWKSTSRPRGHTPFREISVDSTTELADISTESMERIL
jgi:sterol desaturase/sphingolipid hydroxylase (fatty acid hydroxylase superfamily)